jgi:hypothetical protein
VYITGSGGGGGVYTGIVELGLSCIFSNIIPGMTSNTTPSGLAFASSAYIAEWYGMNGVLTTSDAWHSGQASFPIYFGYKPAVVRGVTRYSLACPPSYVNNANTWGSPSAWVFQGSNDTTTGLDGTWVDLDSRSGQVYNGSTAESVYELSGGQVYSAYRLKITASTTGNASIVIGEFKLYSELSGGSGNVAVIDLDPVTLTNPTVGKVVFTGYNADAAAILDVGTNVHVYPMLGGSPGSELSFTSESLGNNKWRFTSGEVNLSGVSTFGVRFTNTVDRNFRIYEALLVWR